MAETEAFVLIRDPIPPTTQNRVVRYTEPEKGLVLRVLELT